MHEAVEKCSPVLFAREGEQLLELIDDGPELPAVGHQAAHDAIDASATLGELIGEAGGLGDGDPPQALGELLERGGTGEHRRHEPLP